jgi:hypothetical protein
MDIPTQVEKSARDITIDNFMKDGGALDHINQGNRLKGIQMALMTTESNTPAMCYCQLADKLCEYGIFDDTYDFKQRILSTIYNNTHYFRNGIEYILSGVPVTQKSDGSYNCIEAGNLFIPIENLFRFLVGGYFSLQNDIIQAYFRYYLEIIQGKCAITRRKRIESSIDPEQLIIDGLNARLASRKRVVSSIDPEKLIIDGMNARLASRKRR